MVAAESKLDAVGDEEGRQGRVDDGQYTQHSEGHANVRDYISRRWHLGRGVELLGGAQLLMIEKGGEFKLLRQAFAFDALIDKRY